MSDPSADSIRRAERIERQRIALIDDMQRNLRTLRQSISRPSLEAAKAIVNNPVTLTPDEQEQWAKSLAEDLAKFCD